MLETIVLLMRGEGSTAIGDGVVPPVCCFSDSTALNPFLDASVSNRNGLV